MALHRGQPVEASSEYEEFERHNEIFASDLHAGKELDLLRWQDVLERSGCDFLYCIGNIISALPSDLRSRTIDTISQFANSSDWNVRDSVARVLGHCGQQRVLPLLRHLLADPEEGLVRLAAVKGLMNLGYTFTPSERQRLLNDSSGMVRAEAAQIYVEQGEIEPVRELLRSRDSQNRLIAAEALIRGGFRDVAGEISDILENEDLSRRVDAVRLLQMSGDRRYIPLLASAEADPKDVVRSAAARAIQVLQRS
ncbi:MAG: HEAT repeat domain-containing protein [Armatimonadota bacterium]|nr:HEAT repeat domain-containing protein [Armatimonadota bacterium]